MCSRLSKANVDVGTQLSSRQICCFLFYNRLNSINKWHNNFDINHLKAYHIVKIKTVCYAKSK